MAIEARTPPPQLVSNCGARSAGAAGWSGFVLQVLFVAALVWLGYEIVSNARANLRRSASPPASAFWQIPRALTSARR